MKSLKLYEIFNDPSTSWAYDWLGMANNGLEEHDQALDTAFNAFELSNGTLEIGAGLGHVIGEAGEINQAKKYSIPRRTKYLKIPISKLLKSLQISVFK